MTTLDTPIQFGPNLEGLLPRNQASYLHEALTRRGNLCGRVWELAYALRLGEMVALRGRVVNSRSFPGLQLLVSVVTGFRRDSVSKRIT